MLFVGRPDDGDYLMRMLARVEGMPLETLRDAVPWNWTTTADYLDALNYTYVAFVPNGLSRSVGSARWTSACT